MSVRIRYRPADPAKPYTALDALREFDPKSGRTLILMSHLTKDHFEVLAFDKLSGEIKLKNQKNHTFSSVFKDRENAHYTPVWR